MPWHNQEQEEVYFIIEGTGEMCLGEERQVVTAGQAVYIPPGVFHQLTNIGDDAAADALLLRAGGRRGPLATGTERHAAPGRRRGPAAAARRLPAMHGETEVSNGVQRQVSRARRVHDASVRNYVRDLTACQPRSNQRDH